MIYGSGKQQMSLEGIMGMVQSSGGEQLRSHAEQKGLDPALLDGVMNLLKGGGGDTGDGASGGGGGFDLSKLMKIVAHLTKGGMNGGGGADGFLDLIGGMSGGDGKTGGKTSFYYIFKNRIKEANIYPILIVVPRKGRGDRASRVNKLHELKIFVIFKCFRKFYAIFARILQKKII